MLRRLRFSGCSRARLHHRRRRRRARNARGSRRGRCAGAGRSAPL